MYISPRICRYLDSSADVATLTLGTTLTKEIVTKGDQFLRETVSSITYRIYHGASHMTYITEHHIYTLTFKDCFCTVHGHSKKEVSVTGSL